MKKSISGWLAALGLVIGLASGLTFSTAASAESGGLAWDKAPNKTNDVAALQNGAKLFVNYCLNCHSAAFMRFNRLQDIGISEQQIKDNLLFTTEKVGETMKANIDARQAKEWFGTTPPDLTLVARSRAGHGGTGADYLYTYLRTYYRDDTKATGWNNLAFPSVAMPNPLWELQGERRPIHAKVEQHGHEADVFTGKWEQVTPGTMTPLQFDTAVGDLVSYMQWMAEPAQNTRIRIGVWVLLFLSMSVIFVWRLNASYWKDVK
ncbi:cytochrome C [Variovorax paradoxus]|jgi:ubiquinol-cytochrome c reductase cytochrome c1 subunit|uniref:cytochrome c1 n=1 Tax=Variovorax TaxID=34072 RepID=UPI0006E66A75|nr:MULTISPECIES: cytochrome c1 [unclassified Variovorax]KPU88247.1 cytochrome C [Variovorax paradoxus]KAF1072788.1 MAG: Ammonia monooxygenase gamma subunit [Variovorax sp.]KPU91472.1 cytochrome C [Variovorax paradoxus]KPU92573.1 cytochrome C [Variovorax paradoxus]KPV14313.1 cytochrome C [Variovorax paradoxus]